MASSRLMVVLLSSWSLVAQESQPSPLPQLPAGQVTIHGQWRTGAALQPFWARLLAPDPHFGGHRTLQLVYTPPPRTALVGTRLVDCPFLLLDEHAALVAWNERQGFSEAQRRGAAYRVVRDRTPDDRAETQLVTVSLSPAPAWDRTVAPLLVALTWRPNTTMVMPLVDVYGDQPAAAISWNQREVLAAGQTWRIVPAADGTVQRLIADHDNDLLILASPQESAP